MKRILINVISVFLLIVSAQAENGPLSVLAIDQNRITGTVIAQFTGTDNQINLQEISVDCPVPAIIDDNEIWNVTQRHITKEEAAHALEAIGQSANGEYSSTPNSMRFSGNWDVPASSDLSKGAAAQQAVRIGLEYFHALGIDVDPSPRIIERPNDLQAYTEQIAQLYAHLYSEPSDHIRSAQEQWKRRHRYETLAPNYTTVQFTIMLDGMRVWPTPSYPISSSKDTADFLSYAVHAYVTVSDSGILVEAGTSCIPEVLSRTQQQEGNASAYALNASPQFIAAPNWQEALRFALEHGAASDLIGNAKDVMKDNTSNTRVIRYGSRSVITSITPYLYPVSKNSLIPVWHIECASEYADGCRF